MPTMIRAHETTKNVPSTHNVRDVSKGIQYLDPDAAPLINFSTEGAKRKKVARNPKFEWNEKGLPPKADQVNGAATTGETSVTVDNGAYFGVNDIVKVEPTGEVFRVTAVNTSTNVLTVSRAVGSTTAATIANNADVLIVGNAFAEGAAKPAVRSHQETTPYNYTQIFRHTFGQTRTEANTDTYVDEGDGRARLRMEKAIEHKIDIERAFLFGERNEDATDTNAPIRYTGGLLYWATSNSKNAGGTLTEAEIEDWLEDVFQNTGGSDTRLLLASPKVISVLDQIAASRIQVVSDRSLTYGVKIKEWVTGHGSLLIAKHRLLTDGLGGTGYSGYAFAIDPKKIRYRFLANSDTKLSTNIEDNGDDRWTDQYLSEVGLEVANPELHGVLTGVTG